MDACPSPSNAVRATPHISFCLHLCTYDESVVQATPQSLGPITPQSRHYKQDDHPTRVGRPRPTGTDGRGGGAPLGSVDALRLRLIGRTRDCGVHQRTLRLEGRPPAPLELDVQLREQRSHCRATHPALLLDSTSVEEVSMADSNAEVVANLGVTDPLQPLPDCSPWWRLGPQPATWAGAREMESLRSQLDDVRICKCSRCARDARVFTLPAASARAACGSTFIQNGSC
jgi:hypothetical protein